MGSPVVSSVPNSQTGLGLLATEPIETELSAGIGLGEVVHDEPWLKTDRKMLARINKLLEDVRRDPFTGIGKPEPLKYHLPGAWSRRIDDEHRLVYIVTEPEIIILAARYHY